MKIILKIAKAEWRSLIYSPVAWLVLLLFCIACGLAFVVPLQNSWRFQVFNLIADETWPGFYGNGLTKLLVGDPSGQLAEKLFLMIPLLTMGIISKELNTGTIKLLYASPIRVREIILGKFLGMIFLVLMLMAFLATILVIVPSLIINADVLQYVSTLLGLMLLAAAYIAIGIFVSSLTSYQIVAGIVTFLVFFVLSAVDRLWQQYDFIRDLTYFLAIGNRTNNFLKGLVTSRDVSYFILITILFLGFAIIKLKSTQESVSWTVPLRRYLALFAIVLCAGYLTSIPGKVLYWDTTSNQSNTIDPAIQAVMKEMDGSPLTITLYTNLFGENVDQGLPQNRNFYIWNIWDQYRRFYPNMIFKYEYFYDIKDALRPGVLGRQQISIEQLRDKRAKELGVSPSLFKSPDVIRKLVDIEDEQAFLVMKLAYKDKEAWLRTYKDNFKWHNPSTFAGTIKRLTRVTPHILFTTGNYERSPFKAGRREYVSSTTSKSSRKALINHGVDSDTISLGSRDLPSHCDLLVVADPRSKLPDGQQQQINNYIARGGNALLLGEPGKTENINDLLTPIGVTLDDGIIVNTNKDEMPHFFNGVITAAGAYMSEETSLSGYRSDKLGILSTTIVGAANISKTTNTADFMIESVLELVGDEDVWIEKGHLVVDSAAPVFATIEGDYRKDKYDIAIKMGRFVNEREQRIIVGGDADLLSDERVAAIGTSYYSWLLNNEYPTYVNHRAPNDIYLQRKPVLIKTVSVIYIYLIPALVVLTGVLLLTRRKRK